MAAPEKKILRNVSVVVGNDTLTTRARSVDIDLSADELDVTTFGGSGYREFEPGLKQGTIAVEFFQGFDSGGTHQVLWPHAEANDAFYIRIGPEGDVAADTNPVFEALVKLFAYKFLQGAVGEASTNPVTFRLIEAPTIDTT